MNTALSSPLALMHPNGVAGDVLVFGSNCPPRLCAPGHHSEPATSAGLAVIAPNLAECGQAGWLAQAVASAAQQLGADGLVYAVVPPRWRLAAMQLLRQHGFTLESSRMHLPDLPTSRYSVPLTERCAHYAFEKLIPTAAHKRRALLLALRLPQVAHMLACVLPAIALVGRRGKRAFQWLFEMNPDLLQLAQPHAPEVILSASWRRQSVSMVMHGFANGAQPVLVAKIIDAGQEDYQAQSTVSEADALANIAPTAQRAGAQVPQLLRLAQFNTHPLIVETALAGQTAATLLTERPDQLPRVLNRLADWLVAWGQLTQTTRRDAAARDLLEQVLLVPAKQLGARLPQAEAYLTWLSQQCAALQNALMSVAAHHDLTLWNVLLDHNDQLGVVDWQEARTCALPLTDFAYAAVDAVVLAQRWDRLRAFKACFAPEGVFRPITQTALLRLASALQVPLERMDVYVHACFLGHAANEQLRADRDTPKPFLEIAAWLATYHQDFREWMKQ